MRTSTITVTVGSPGAATARQMLAENMAVLRACERRKVLLLDTDCGQHCARWGQAREQARLRPAVGTMRVECNDLPGALDAARTRYDDIVIDTEAGTSGARRGLVAARVALAVVDPSDCLGLLANCLNTARLFNPGLRIRCVVASDEYGPSASERGRIVAFAASIGGAAVAMTPVRVPVLAWGAAGPGQCAADLVSSEGAADMTCLYRELYPASPSPARSSGWRLFSA